MKVASPLILASALLLSIGCIAQPKPSTKEAAKAVPATAGAPTCVTSCIVNVTIPAGCGSGIRVAPDPIVVGPRQNVRITWKIRTPNWRFDTNGIVVYLGGPAFTEYTRAAEDTEFTVNHGNTRPGAYKYDINLLDPAGQPCRLDPTIVDQ